MNTRPNVLVILGPTATGKSDLAVYLAQRFHGEVISADSRQIYRGMNMGTGKISRAEMRGIPHHMLDIIAPQTSFSASQYKKRAEREIEKILTRRKIPIICGGTGFYIDSVTKNLTFPEVPPNKKLRALLERQSLTYLVSKLKKLSPDRAKHIDIHNRVRLIRAIEIATALGVIPQVQENPSPYNFIFIGLDTSNRVLQKRIRIRLQRRMRKGMVDEVQKLHADGVSWKRFESFGLEYKEIALFLQKKINKKQMIDNLENSIWQYAKRQRTWFKRNEKIHWFKPNEKTKVFHYLETRIK